MLDLYKLVRSQIAATSEDDLRWFMIEADHSRLDMTNKKHIEALRLRASEHGLMLDKGRGRGWTPIDPNRNRRDPNDLGGLRLRCAHPKKPGRYQTLIGEHYNASCDDVEQAIRAYRRGDIP